MVEVRIPERDVKRVQQLISGLSNKDRGGVWYGAMDKVGELLLRRLKMNVTNRILKVRTGRLRASLNKMMKVDAEGLKTIVGSGVGVGRRVKYATILEVGGVIIPKRAKFLTIPLRPALTKAGVTKYPSARDYPNTIVFKNMIWQKEGRKLVPLFVLKKEVKIPAKRYMYKTAKQVAKKIGKIFIGAVERFVRRIKG